MLDINERLNNFENRLMEIEVKLGIAKEVAARSQTPPVARSVPTKYRGAPNRLQLGIIWLFYRRRDGDEETKRASAIRRGAYSESGPDIYRALWDGKEGDLTFGSMRSTATTIIGPSRAIEPRSPTSYVEAIESAYEWLADRIGSSRRR